MNKTLGIITLIFLSLVSCNSIKKTTDTRTGISNVVTAELKASDIKIIEGNVPLDCRSLRIRLLDVTPAGLIAIHSHENRPAILSMARGGMTVYAYHKNPVVLNYGESYREFNDIIHYAVNQSKTDTMSVVTFDFLDENTKACNGKTYNESYLPLLDKLKMNNDPFYVNAPKSAKDEINHPYFSVKLQDIKFPKGSSELKDRSLRVRRITLNEGVSTGVQNFLNRPTYIIALEGNMKIKNIDANTNSILRPLEGANLVNAGKVEIINTGAGKVMYYVMELWDPKDGNIL